MHLETAARPDEGLERALGVQSGIMFVVGGVPYPPFLYGWAALFVVFTGGPAAVGVGFATYLS